MIDNDRTGKKKKMKHGITGVLIKQGDQI